MLILYGQTVALNHLIGSNQINVVKLENEIDFPSYESGSIYRVVHIHVFHCYTMFSKFNFKDGKYDNIVMSSEQLESEDVKNYALRMALEAKRTPSWAFFHLLKETISNKY